MAMRLAVPIGSVLLCAACASAASSAVTKENPIRKVIVLMQDMQKEIEGELTKEKDLYEKFLCICDTQDDELAAVIEKTNQNIAELSSRLEEETSEKKQLEEALKGHYQDRTSAQQDLEKATSLREKEKTEAEENIASTKFSVDALGKAIPALEKGTSSLMQSDQKTALEKVMEHTELVDSFDRREVLSFLAGSTDAPASGQILGILKQMKDEMEKGLEEAIKNEQVATTGFSDLKSVKDEEIEVASEGIETKEKRAGELAVSISQNTDALEDAKTEKGDAERFLATLKVQCVEQKKAWEDRFKLRSDEIAAISEAIKILNDDDSLEVFSKTAKSALVETGSRRPAFLQQAPKASKLERTEAIIAKAAAASKKDVQLALLSNILSSQLRVAKKGGDKETGDFSGVIKMLDGMTEVLKKEQEDDAKKKEWCVSELQKAEGQEKVKQEQQDTLTSTVAELQDEIASIDEQIKTLHQEVSDLDRAVASATEQRKKEHAEYADTAAMTEAAVALVAKAKNRLQKFYNPSQYKEEPASFVQVSVLVAPPELPNMPEYKPAAAGGVVGMMDQITHELKMDQKEAEMEEKGAQKEYVTLMQESQVSREQDLKSITDQENSKAILEEKMNDAKEAKKMAFDELSNAHKFTSELHATCDFVVQNFELRAEARANEIESLKNAKAVMEAEG